MCCIILYYWNLKKGHFLFLECQTFFVCPQVNTVNHLPSLRLYSKPSDRLFFESVKDSRFEPATTCTVSAIGALSMSHHLLFINTHFLVPVSHIPLFRESLPLFCESHSKFIVVRSHWSDKTTLLFRGSLLLLRDSLTRESSSVNY